MARSTLIPATAAPRIPERSTAGSLATVKRFTRTERSMHWLQASSFLLLLLTGFALQLPSIEALIGHRALLREIHLSSAFFFFFGPAVIALAGDRRSVALDVAAVDSWDQDDFRWLVPFPLLRALGIRTPPQGRFNAGQKLNAIFVVWSTLTFTVSGLIMWQNRRFGLLTVSHANTIHTSLAYLALVAFLGHIFLATVWPQTRHSFRAITQGWVRVDWAAMHHAKWLDRLPAPPPPPRHDAARTALQIVLGAYIALLAVRVYFFSLGANTTDKVTTWLYDLTAFPGAASIRPSTGLHVIDWIGLLYLVLFVGLWYAADRLRRLPAAA